MDSWSVPQRMEFCSGNLYGISVSGNKITSSIFTSTAADGGATVINGGTFGMEGGFAVTIVLIIAIVVVGKHLESKGKLIEKSEQPSQNEIEFEELKKKWRARWECLMMIFSEIQMDTIRIEM